MQKENLTEDKNSFSEKHCVTYEKLCRTSGHLVF